MNEQVDDGLHRPMDRQVSANKWLNSRRQDDLHEQVMVLRA